MSNAPCAARKFQDQTVYDTALERISYIYNAFDHVFVSFSGGKDSTACLNLTIQVAAGLGKLPVRVVFFDEECIPDQTVEYVERIARRPDVNLEWYCAPSEQRNACSVAMPNWYPWAPEDRHKWVRELPPRALLNYPVKPPRRIPLSDVPQFVSPPSLGSVGMIMGIRTQESLTRYRSIVQKPDGNLAYISSDDNAAWIRKVYPIYDWTTEDVWLAPLLHGWDYNRAYDVMDQAGVSMVDQRCSPAFGEQPLRKLWCFPICWPKLWGRMCDRVPGAATALRYANTELYGKGAYSKGTELTWADRTRTALLEWPPETAAELAKAVRQMVCKHYDYTEDPLPDEVPHPVSGMSWKEMARIAIIGNNKDRQRQKVDLRARTVRMRVDSDPKGSEQRSEGER
jgi:predicted phosphoadenosine phosphosulfate sulfurtransferase